MYILGQTLGILGFIFSIVSFLQSDDRKMKNYLGLSSFLVSVGYYMIGAVTGAVSMFISASRNIAAGLMPKNKIVYVFFIALTIVTGYYLYKKPLDILPVLGALVATTALFMFEGVMMRVLMILSCTLWLAYDVSSWAIGPMLMQAFNIIACLIAIRSLQAKAIS